MTVKITYPKVAKTKMWRQDIINWAKWIFVLVSIICALVNLAAGGPAWSLISIWGLWMVWSFFISPVLVEYNRISSWFRFLTNSSIMLFIIDSLSFSGWSIMVVPIVQFGGLAVSAILFFTDFERQKQNMLPMLLLTVICLIYSIGGLLLGRVTWEMITMGAIAFLLLIACFVVLGNGFVREFKKRFHTR